MEADQFDAAAEDRLYWAKLLTVLREALISVEDKKEKEFGTKTGVWIEKLQPAIPPQYLTVSGEGQAALNAICGGTNAPAPPKPASTRRGAPPPTTTSAGGPSEVGCLLLTCRSVNLNSSSGKADAHTIIAEGLADELRSRTNYFLHDGTKVTGDIVGAESTNLTFVFQVAVKLARPVKL